MSVTTRRRVRPRRSAVQPLFCDCFLSSWLDQTGERRTRTCVDQFVYMCLLSTWLCRLHIMGVFESTLARSRLSRLAIAASSFPGSCDMCLRSRGCPVLPDIELAVSARHPAVSARHHTTRIRLLNAQDLLLVAAAKLQCAVHISNCIQSAVAYNSSRF